jgi:hypothetical protein
VRTRSVFEITPQACDVLRTMNILNHSYFTGDELTSATNAVFDSLRVGGLWIVGRTWEEDLRNHATFFMRREDGWQVLGRTGNGSEIEQLALAASAGRSMRGP